MTAKKTDSSPLLSALDSQSSQLELKAEIQSGENLWELDSRALLDFLTGRRTADFGTFLAQARDCGRLLAAFVPPEGFSAPAAAEPPSLDEQTLKNLAAGSLADYYRLALGREKASNYADRAAGPAADNFPRGPESLRPALRALERQIQAVEKSIDELERAWPATKPGFQNAVSPLEKRLDKFKTSRIKLLRAAQLWPRLKRQASAWPREAVLIWQRAQRLERAVKLCLKSLELVRDEDEDGQAFSGRDRVSRGVGRLSSELASAVGRAKLIVEDSASLGEDLRTLASDLDKFLTVAADGSQSRWDWEELGRKLSRRLTHCEKQDDALRLQAVEAASVLSSSLGALAEAERRLAGRRQAEAAERLRTVSRGVEALWAELIETRRELARLYFAVPLHLAYPEYLEQAFLSAASTLGRTQALLEDLRHKLSVAAGRLPGSGRLQAEAEEMAEKLSLLPSRSADLKLAQIRLKALLGAVEKNRRLAGAELDLERGRRENLRLRRRLKAAAAEKERLSQQLHLAGQTLGELGLMKARLLKVAEAKNQLLRLTEERHQSLVEENAFLKAERLDFMEKSSRLSTLYTVEKRNLKRLTKDIELKEGLLSSRTQLLAEAQASRRDLEQSLAQTKLQLDESERQRQELEERLNSQGQILEGVLAQSEGLGAELAGRQRGLEKISRLRLSWAEKAARLRRRLDLLSEAHRALQKAADRRDRRLELAEESGRLAAEALGRRQENIIRLAASQRKLRAQLGEARLKLAEMEKQRLDLVERLQQAQAAESKARKLKLERETLSAELSQLKSELQDDLTPFIKLLAASLWQSQAELSRLKAGAAETWPEDFKFSPPAGELGRLKRQLESVEEERLRQTRLAGEQADMLRQELKQARAARDEVVARNLKLMQTVSTLSSRQEKLQRALKLMKERGGQKRDLSSLARLEPLTLHFLNEAEAALATQPDELSAQLLAQMRRRCLSLGSGSYDELMDPQLQSQLERLGPLVSFLARSFLDAVSQLAQARGERASLAAELDKLSLSGRALAESLKSREEEVAELRDEAFNLTRQRDALELKAAAGEEQIESLSEQLAQADRNLAENDGRLEASWAALNYLGSKADDAVGRLKSHLEDQGRQLRQLRERLSQRDEKIRELELRQDQAALLYWLIITRALDESPAPAAAEPLEGEIIRLKAPVPQSPGEAAATEPNASGDGETQSLNRLEGLKKAAGRGLLTLILAGALILSEQPPAESSQASFIFSPPTAEAALVTRLDSPYIGRSVSLDLIAPSVRLAGAKAVERTVTELVRNLAEAHQISAGEFLSLVRSVRGQTETVQLKEFEGRLGALALLRSHFPKMSLQMAAWPAEALSPEKLTALMKSAADFKSHEGAFWERLFFDYLARLDQGQALKALLAQLGQKKVLAAEPRYEFAGRLAPLSDLENMGSERFIEFLAGHIKSSWPDAGGPNRERAGLRLAGSIYFAARIFRLPLTLLASCLHGEAEAKRADYFGRGSTEAIIERCAYLRGLAHDIGLNWQPGRPALCDLDRLMQEAAVETGLEAEEIYRKKMLLIQAYNKKLSSSHDLLSNLEEGRESAFNGRRAGLRVPLKTRRSAAPLASSALETEPNFILTGEK